MAEFKAALVYISGIIDPLLTVYWIVQGFFFGFGLALVTAVGWLVNDVIFNKKFNLTIVNVSAYYLLVWMSFMLVTFFYIFYF